MRSWRLIWRTDGIVPYLAAPASFKRLLGGERTARQFNKRRAGGAVRDPLLGEAELLHEVAAIPEPILARLTVASTATKSGRKTRPSPTAARTRSLPSRLIPHRHRPRAELQPAHELQVDTLR